MKRTLLAITLLALPAPAQWLNIPTPGMPRTADGKPNLAAPTPKSADGHPDISGLWMRDPAPSPRPADAGPNNSIAQYMPVGTDVGMLPWAAELYKKRALVDRGAGRPSERCLPHSIPDQFLINVPLRFVQTPNLTILLYEEFTHYRNIYTDGRAHPADMLPTWLGYSVGKWEGDTFVIDTRGITDRTWLDDSGHPHTEAMRTLERFRRTDFGHMSLEIVIEDPQTYANPLTMKMSFTFMPDTDMIEDICDNERDNQHMRVQ